MAPMQLFITGATGYIGGSVLNKLVQTHPELQISALLRAPSQEFTAKYPSIRVIKGTFDDFDVIKKAAQGADIVIHTGDIDHAGCAKAILSGLSKRTEESYLIHLSGTGCISDEWDQTWEGKVNPHVWHDIDEIDKLYNLPARARHHEIDRSIMDASNDTLKTVVICPPDIYGQSSSVGSRTTFLVPNYVEALLEHKEAFYLGDGDNMRAVTHIDDVVDIFILLVEEALKGGGRAQWGKKGFYFAVSDEVRWKDAAEAIRKLGQQQGWLEKNVETVSWDKEKLTSKFPGQGGLVLYLWGSNSRAESAKAKQLGWNPHGPSFWEALIEDVKIAAKNVQTKSP